jgi:hypothetical protein
MIDWYMLLAPLVVLPIIQLFAFVGCDLEDYGTADPLTVTLWVDEPIKDSWPAAAKVTFNMTITNSVKKYMETQESSSTFLDPSPESYPIPVPLEFGAPFDVVLDCTIKFSVRDAKDIEIGNAFPPGDPYPKVRESDKWSFRLEPNGAKIVDETV